MILVRTSHNAGCPVCGYAVKQKQTNIEKNRLKGNTLAIKFPEVAKDWDYEKAGKDCSCGAGICGVATGAGFCAEF